MSRYSVCTTEPFDDDLDAALSWRLAHVGRLSASRLMDSYDALRASPASFPLLGSYVDDSPYRWKQLEGYTAIYSVDESAHEVTLMRLFHMTSDWRNRLLEDASIE